MKHRAVRHFHYLLIPASFLLVLRGMEAIFHAGQTLEQAAMSALLYSYVVLAWQMSAE